MSKKTSYKSSIDQIEAVISQIENDDLDVDELGKLVKKAAKLIRQCKAQLKGTEDELNNTLEGLE